MNLTPSNSASEDAQSGAVSGVLPARGMQLTETALARIRATLSAAPPDSAIRITIQGGGCTGLTCDLRPDTFRERDRTLQLENIRILVDPKSFIYLHGMTLDYNQQTFPQGFIVVTAEQASSTGCGCASVSQSHA